ncbi:uncharacterized protein LOC129718348 [Wyeomyia smithii]|uniref:uncharacterized protein LOC129718348 n=1 Tax=Wyeomyia smithii TaxID=174621 RepID=UPI002467FD46|nr:uncharacterized protein LOC129718348 [Wyeomyia smithii]
MGVSRSTVTISVLLFLSVLSAIDGGIISYLDILRRVSGVRGDIRTNLRTIRKLAVQNGLIKAANESVSPVATPFEPPHPIGVYNESNYAVTPVNKGRKKGDGGNKVVKGGGGDLGDFGFGESPYSLLDGTGGVRKKGRRRKHHKIKGWRRHIRKAIPIALAVLALKAMLVHFILKKLALATGLSLLLSAKSLLVSLLIAVKLWVSHPQSHDKSESNKLEVVHIPIRKETGFHKKIQLQKVRSKGKSIVKLEKPTQKTPSFSQYTSGYPIKHTHQQMEEFGGKYIPLGFESSHYNFDATTQPTTYLDALPETTDHDNYFDVNDLQFARREGWDGWTGWNRGDDSDSYSGAYDQKQQMLDYIPNANYGRPDSNSNAHGGYNQDFLNYDSWGKGSDQPNYKQRNLSQMKYRKSLLKDA